MKRWRVNAYGIQWDAGKGEYDVSDLPRNLSVEVDAYSREGAIEEGLSEMTDAYGALIEGTEQIVAEAILIYIT